MANYRKSFNFKNGVQVDTDNFIVDSVGKVGIGTTIPRQFLDVYGNDSGAVQVQGKVNISGLTTTTKLYAGIGTIENLFSTYSDIGIGTFEQLKVGNSPTVNNLIGYAYTAWITDNGGVGLRTDSAVGIGTTTSSDYNLLIGSDPRVNGSSGIGFGDGNINATGIITTNSLKLKTPRDFSVSGDVVTHTISFDGTNNVALGVTLSNNFSANTAGIITASKFSGDLTGVASTATKLETSRDFSVSGDVVTHTISFDGTSNVALGVTLSNNFSANTAGIITASKFSGDLTGVALTVTSGIITDITITNLDQVTEGIATFTNIDGSYGNFDNLDVGIGTIKSLLIKDDGSVSTLIIQNDSISNISIGKSGSTGNERAELSYNPNDATLEITNYDTGDINVNLHAGTSGIDTGGFKVRYDSSVKLNVTYDGSVSINKDSPDPEYNLDVNGEIKSTGNYVVGLVTVTNGSESFTLDPLTPPLRVGDDLNFPSGISTFNNIDVIGVITSDDNNDPLELGNTIFNRPAVSIGSSSLDIGYSLEDSGTEKYNIELTRTDIRSLGGIATFAGIAATDVSLIVNGSLGVGQTHFSGNIDNYINSRTTKLGITTVIGEFFALGDPETEGNILGISTIYNAGFNSIDPIIPFTYISGGYIGIGTTNAFEFHTPGYKGVVKRYNFFVDNESIVGFTGKIVVRRPSFQSNEDLIYTERTVADPRAPIGGTDTIRSSGLPIFNYGRNLDIDTTSSTMIFDGSLSIVPTIPKKVSGYGNPNLGSEGVGFVYEGGLGPDFTGREVDPNTGDTNPQRLTLVGINTYLPRCLLDVGAASTTVNSYFVPPTLSQSELDIVSNLWNSSTGIGTENSRRITPDGVVPGALVYNSTNQRLEIGSGSSEFSGIPKLEKYYNGGTAHEFLVHPPFNGNNPESATGVPNGATYYNTSTHKLRLKANGTWVSLN